MLFSIEFHRWLRTFTASDIDPTLSVTGTFKVCSVSKCQKKKVLLVDDSAEVRVSLRRLFDSHPKFVVCGEAEHGREAIDKAPSLRPDLIVLDMSMPVMNGLEAAPLLIKILPNVWLILFTAYDWPELYQLARSAGIHAVVQKSKAVTHLIAQAEALFGMTS